MMLESNLDIFMFLNSHLSQKLFNILNLFGQINSKLLLFMDHSSKLKYPTSCLVSFMDETLFLFHLNSHNRGQERDG